MTQMGSVLRIFQKSLAAPLHASSIQKPGQTKSQQHSTEQDESRRLGHYRRIREELSERRGKRRTLWLIMISGGLDGRGEWIRTTGLLVPNQALYQAEPRPDDEDCNASLPSCELRNDIPPWYRDDHRAACR